MMQLSLETAILGLTVFVVVSLTGLNKHPILFGLSCRMGSCSHNFLTEQYWIHDLES